MNDFLTGGSAAAERPSQWFHGGPSSGAAHPCAKRFDRPFYLEHCGFGLSGPFFSLRPEYGNLVVACAHRLCRLRQR